MQKKRYSDTTDDFINIYTQVNIDPVITSLLAPKIMPLLHRARNSDFIVQFILMWFVIVTKGNRI